MKKIITFLLMLFLSLSFTIGIVSAEDNGQGFLTAKRNRLSKLENALNNQLLIV